MEKNVLDFKSGLFKVISDANRLKILELLRDGPLCQCEIIPVIGQSQPTVSRHLSLLEDAGLIHKTRKGTKTFYNVVDPHIYRLIDSIDDNLKTLITKERTRKLPI